MRRSTARPISLFSFLLTIAWCDSVAGQTVIPQIADGGGWRTTLILANTSATSATTSVTFYQETPDETPNGETTAWSPRFLEETSLQSVTLSGGDTLILHTAGTSTQMTQGWAQVQGDPAIEVSAVFTQRMEGRPDQDSTVLAAPASNHVLIPYDNRNGFATTIAIANPEPCPQFVNFAFENTVGLNLQTAQVFLPPFGHIAFAIPQQFTETSGQLGVTELTTSVFNFSAIAIRFNPTGSFTSSPAIPLSGPAILPAVIHPIDDDRIGSQQQP